MMKNLCFALFVALVSSAYSQSEYDKTIFRSAESGQIVTLNIDVRDYPINDIGSLKDELIAFEEKIVHVDFKESEGLLEIQYNSEMLLSDLVNAFDKNNVGYARDFNKMNPTPTSNF